MKEHDLPIHEIDFVPHYEDISIEMEEGELRDVELHDGSHLRLRKLDRDYDPTSKRNAVRLIEETEEKGEVATGILYIKPREENFFDQLGMGEAPLATLPESIPRPPQSALEIVMEELR